LLTSLYQLANNGSRAEHQEISVQQKFQNKLYHFNRNSQPK